MYTAGKANVTIWSFTCKKKRGDQHQLTVEQFPGYAKENNSTVLLMLIFVSRIRQQDLFS